MKIGIIGTGQIGATLIRQYTKAGHDVKITNARNVEKSKTLEAETGAKTVSLDQVAHNVEVLVISIPLIEIPNLSKSLARKISADTVVIDTSNYYPIRDGRIDEIENGTTESVWVSQQLSAPVIKAYNSILAGSLVYSGHSKGDPLRLALPVSGDDKQSKDLVSTLIDDSGFDSLDYGMLQDSWRQQPGSPVYCTDLTLPQLKNSIAKARKELLSQRRELGLKFILSHDPELWMDIVEYNRVIYESDLDS